MLKNFFRKMLGVDDLEAKINHLQSRVSEQDVQIINAAKQRELITRVASEKNIDSTISDFLQESGIEINDANRDKVMVGISASDAVERYGFKKFNTIHDEESVRSSIISLREFANHPEKYIHKSSKGVFSFPLSMNVRNVSHIFNDLGNVGINYTMSEFDFQIISNSLEGHDATDNSVSETLNSALTLVRANSEFSSNHLKMDPFDFLTNYEGLVSYLKESNLNERNKQRALNAVALSKAVYVAGFEILSGVRIKNTEDLVSYESPDNSEYNSLIDSESTFSGKLYNEIKTLLLKDMRGFRDYDINQLLPIRSIDNFRRLASERTSEIIANDSSRNGLTAYLNKDLSDYTPAESILMSCYFARNIIASYKKPDDSIVDVLSGVLPDNVEGKCTDYTGLALNYLREFIVPLNPDKFKHWSFGYEVDIIGNNYKHCYMKAVHENPDGTHDIFFIDPTSLSSLNINQLKTPSNIASIASTENYPVQIVRDAEDLMYTPLN